MSGIRTIKKNWNPFKAAIEANSFGELQGIYRAWLMQVFQDFTKEYPDAKMLGSELKSEIDGSYTLTVYGERPVPKIEGTRPVGVIVDEVASVNLANFSPRTTEGS